jgi:hypothetical protein
MSNGGVLLCRPRGGFNDMLVQIEKCWRYALKSERLLFIDASRSGFLDCLNNYFYNLDGATFGVPTIHSGMTFFPNHDTLKNLDYTTQYNRDLRNFTFKNSEVLVTFDFSKIYSHDVLIHEQCGGGNTSIEVLKKLKLLPEIAEKIRQQIYDLGDYDSIHVRNTDYTTNYKKFFSELLIPSERKVVLCSDDFACEEYARSFFSNRVFIPNPSPDTNQKPLHSNKNLDRKSTNISAMSDLLILASGKNFHYTKIEKGFISGFTKLAKSLHDNPSTINNLLGD